MARTRRKKRRTHANRSTTTTTTSSGAELAGEGGVPRSFVLASAQSGILLKRLMIDFRRVMEPFTATRLRIRKSNKVKDFVQVAGPLGITHFVLFNKTDAATNMRIARVPHGPTLTFRVTSYSLVRDVLRSQRRPVSPSNEYQSAPLVVLNNFPSEESHSKIVVATLRNMFPAINIEKINLKDARRVVLFNYQAETQSINIRHYAVTIIHGGLTRSVSKLIRTKIPSLSDMEDISEYILANNGADSEDEDAAENRVQVPRSSSSRSGKRGGSVTDQKSVRLREIGPRLDIQLIKIQKDFCGGDVLYHRLIHKTPEEVAALKKQREKKITEKKQRQAEQQRNVERKQREKEEQRRAAVAHQLEVEKRRKQSQPGSEEEPADGDDDNDGGDGGEEENFEDVESAGEVDEDDDEVYEDMEDEEEEEDEEGAEVDDEEEDLAGIDEDEEEDEQPAPTPSHSRKRHRRK